jgi:hypothetical protein
MNAFLIRRDCRRLSGDNALRDFYFQKKCYSAAFVLRMLRCSLEPKKKSVLR